MGRRRFFANFGRKKVSYAQRAPKTLTQLFTADFLYGIRYTIKMSETYFKKYTVYHITWGYPTKLFWVNWWSRFPNFWYQLGTWNEMFFENFFELFNTIFWIFNTNIFNTIFYISNAIVFVFLTLKGFTIIFFRAKTF